MSGRVCVAKDDNRLVDNDACSGNVLLNDVDSVSLWFDISWPVVGSRSMGEVLVLKRLP